MTENEKNPTADDSVELTEDKNEPTTEKISKVPEGEIAEAELVEDVNSQTPPNSDNGDDSTESGNESEDSDSSEGDDDLDDEENGDDDDSEELESESKMAKTSPKVKKDKRRHDEDDDKSDELETPRNQRESKSKAEFQAEIREQIENCKFEIVASLQENIHTELNEVMERQIRRVERRRRAGFWLRDIIILVLSIALGCCLYWLYDAEYFDFLKVSQRAVDRDTNSSDIATFIQNKPEEVKDKDWYLQKYGDLFQDLQIGLNANNISSYYLYSGDHKVSEIPTEYLLAMAYNKLGTTANAVVDTPTGVQSSSAAVSNTIIAAADLQKAFAELVGSSEGFEKQGFTHGCADFQYDKASDSFITTTIICANTETNSRKILEEIDDAYEEGNVLYFMTTAGIYDKASRSFYGFDDLFKPLVKGVDESDLAEHASLLNHYQYQFKKKNEQYYFSSIVKLD